MVIGTQHGDRLLRRLGRHGVALSWLVRSSVVRRHWRYHSPDDTGHLSSSYSSIHESRFYTSYAIAGDDVGHAVAIPTSCVPVALSRSVLTSLCRYLAIGLPCSTVDLRSNLRTKTPW